MSSILLAPGPETACPPVLPSFPVVKLSPPVEPPPVIDDAAQDDRLSFRSRDPEVIDLLVSKDGTTYELWSNCTDANIYPWHILNLTSSRE